MILACEVEIMGVNFVEQVQIQSRQLPSSSHNEFTTEVVLTLTNSATSPADRSVSLTIMNSVVSKLPLKIDIKEVVDLIRVLGKLEGFAKLVVTVTATVMVYENVLKVNN